MAAAGKMKTIWNCYKTTLYVFDMLVGIGVLVLPGNFASAGWVVGLIYTFLYGFLSYISFTFVIEALSVANKIKGSGDFSLDGEFDLSEFAVTFFKPQGMALVHMVMIIYLSGSLTIHTAIFAKSVTFLACESWNESDDDFGDKCAGGSLSKYDVYRICCAALILVAGPLTFFSLDKLQTAYLSCRCVRWSMLLCFIVASGLCYLGNYGTRGRPNKVDIRGGIGFTGNCLYAFSYHHLLPHIVNGIKQKEQAKLMISVMIALVPVFYAAMSLLAVFAFEKVQDVVTLSFVTIEDGFSGYRVWGYVLSVYPIVAVCISFPFLCIILQEHLKDLFLDMERFEEYNFFMRRLLFPIMAFVPCTLSFVTTNIRSLVVAAGSYPGVCVQFLIPALLVLYARRHCRQNYGIDNRENRYGSPFKSDGFIYFVLVWAFLDFVGLNGNLLLDSL